MSYLAKELGITKSTLYHWYQSKEEIFNDIYKSGHKTLMSNGFKLSLNGTIKEVLLRASKNWEELFENEELAPYLRMIFSLHFTDERANEEHNALILMLKSQADVIIGSINVGNQAILSNLFSSLLLSNLERILSNEESNLEKDITNFANLLTEIADK